MGAAIGVKLLLCFFIVIILVPFLSFGAPSPSGFMESAREALMASLHRQGERRFQVQRSTPGGPDQHHH
ncbi:hypothetical protein SDJN03_01247, partial [Cucurbita argyrosperma subsp. sororia]